MSEIRSEPCSACPYRVDVPSGIWTDDEYAKLPPYDAETGYQPIRLFMCHATPEHVCCGWAAVGSNRGHEFDLLALRFAGIGEVPTPRTPLVGSHTEAAERGSADVAAPGDEARAAMDRLLRKYPRLVTQPDPPGHSDCHSTGDNPPPSPNTH